MREERKLAGALKILVIDDVDANFPDSLGHAIGVGVRVEVVRRIVDYVRARVSPFRRAGETSWNL